MNYIGDFAPAATIRSAWNSSDANGASITRSTNGTISVYKDGGTTQSTAGVTDTEDFDALTGVHLVAIDTSADGTFYSAGSDFIVVLSAATIDTRTVNAALFSFSLRNRTNLTAAQVNAEVLDVMTVDTFAEASAVPAATSTLKDKLNWLFALARNRLTQTASVQALRNDANSSDIATAAVSDNGTTAVRDEWT